MLALNARRRVRARVGVYMMAFGDFGGRDDGGCDSVRCGGRCCRVCKDAEMSTCFM